MKDITSNNLVGCFICEKVIEITAEQYAKKVKGDYKPLCKTCNERYKDFNLLTNFDDDTPCSTTGVINLVFSREGKNDRIKKSGKVRRKSPKN
jgi:hypothetical protein